MAQFPAFPLWTDAYLGDTTHLSTIEHGAYLLLLIAAWRSKEGTLPDDDLMLAKYSQLTKKQWLRIRPIIELFFRVENGCWNQGRLQDELEAVRQHSKSQSKKSRARWLKNNDSPDAAALPGECPGNPSPTPTPTPLKEYAFFGKVVRLNNHDYLRWKSTYFSIKDFDAELSTIDGWLSGKPEKQSNWFMVASSWLNKKHQDGVGKNPAKKKSNWEEWANAGK